MWFRCLQCESCFGEPHQYTEEDRDREMEELFSLEDPDPSLMEVEQELSDKVGQYCCPECFYSEFEDARC